MKLTLYQGNSLDALKRLPEESIDCIVTSSPYYGLRDYSSVETISAKTEQAVIDLTDTKIREYEKKYAGYRFHHNDPQSNDEKKTWFCTIRIDIDAVWDADPECEHEWKEISNGRTDETGFERNRKGLNNAAETLDGNKRNAVSRLAPVTHDSNVCFKCHAWKGQLGLEPTYKMFIEHLLLITNELKRVLKPTGTLFWNMGDTYSGAGQKDTGKASYDASDFRHFPIKSNLPNKSLMMIPERFTMAMIDDGWILRNKIVWYKRNGMPSSVKDRLSNKWEYVFFFTKSQKYYFDLDSIRKPLAESSVKRISQKNIPNQFKSGKSVEFAETNPVNNIPKIMNNMHNSFNIRVRDAKKGILDKKWGDKYTASDEEIANYDEKNYTSKTSNNTYQKYQQDGAYKGSHSGYLNEDGSLRVNLSGANPGDVIYDSKYMKYDYGQTLQGFTRDNTIEKARKQSYIDAVKLFPDDVKKQKEYIKNIHDHLGHPNGANPGDVISQPAVRHKSWASNPGHDFTHERKYDPDADGSDFLDIPTMPHSFAHFAVFPETLVEPLIKAGCPLDGVVLDPFAGSGTVGVVAMKQNKNAVLIEISPEYCNIIKKRLNWGAGLGVEYESFPKADVMEAPNE